MIETYLKPESVSQAVALKAEHGAKAVFFGGGSKLNAAPTKTEKTVAIALCGLGLNEIVREGEGVRIGALARLQPLLDNELTPPALKQAIGFIYSRNIRNQATLGGEIASAKEESPLAPALLVLQAQLVLGDGKTVALEDYLRSDRSELIQAVVIPNTNVLCATQKVSRSSAGLNVLVAAVAVPAAGKMLIALDGVAAHPMRLRDVESSGLEGEALEKAVAAAVQPKADIRGSVEYKRYIAGVIVADLLAACRQTEAK